MKKIVAILLVMVLCCTMISALADEEHVLRICTPNSEGLQSIYPLFEETTGIKVISESLGTGDCMAKIRGEKEQEYSSFDRVQPSSAAAFRRIVHHDPLLYHPAFALHHPVLLRHIEEHFAQH